MVEAALAFPNIDPVIIHIYGPISIRWYALSYIAGLLLGWFYVVKLLQNATLWGEPPFKGKPPATPDDIGDLFVWHVAPHPHAGNLRPDRGRERFDRDGLELADSGLRLLRKVGGDGHHSPRACLAAPA